METANKIDYILQHITSLLTKNSDQILLEQLGIGYSQYKILRVLENEVPIKQNIIALSLGQTEASISRQIDILETKLYISKKVDLTNKRVRLILITEKGKKITSATRKVLAKYHNELFKNFSDKKQLELLKLLEDYHDNICNQLHSPGTGYINYLADS